MKSFLLVLKNLRRNKLRSLLTALAVVALVAIFSIIRTVVRGMDDFTAEKGGNVKVIVSDRYNIMMPFHRRYLDEITDPNSEINERLRRECDFDRERHTLWHFAIFSLDKEMKDKEQQFFLLATLPEKIPTMTDGIDLNDVDPRAIELMRKPPRSGPANSGIVVGELILRKIKKQVGDQFKAWAIGHRKGGGLREPIEMEFEIVAAIPMENRWNGAGFMDYAYLDKTLNAEKNEFDGRIHYGWLEFKDKPTAEKAGILIEKNNPDLKAETASTAFSRFLAPLEPVLRGIKWVLVPAIIAVMTLILANTFSITVRERFIEMAVLKVLGFPSSRILLLVLGEAVLVGTLAGVLGAVVTYGFINILIGGLPLEGFPLMKMPAAIFWWGPLIGFFTAFAGGIIPAIVACRVKVSHVFANVA